MAGTQCQGLFQPAEISNIGRPVIHHVGSWLTHPRVGKIRYKDYIDGGCVFVAGACALLRVEVSPLRTVGCFRNCSKYCCTYC